MNILLLTERIGARSGWERYSAELIRALRKKGHNVFVLCAEKNPEYMDIPQVVVLPPALSARRSYFLSKYFASRAERILRKENFVPDVIHEIVEPYACIAHDLSRRIHCSYVLTLHGSFAVRPLLSRLYRRRVAQAYRNARRVVCISRYTEKQVKHYVPDTPTIVIAGGVTLPKETRDDSEREQLYQNRKSLILSAGVVKERKGYLELLRAMPLVREKVPTATLAIVGDTQNDAAYFFGLQVFVGEHHLQSAVEFKGKVSDAELNELYAAAKVFALTPISTPRSFEGFGLVYLEANARGVPVVGSYENGGEDAIEEGESGFLAHANNPQEIADCLISILTMPQKEYVSMAYAAYAHAREFPWSKTVEKYEQLYTDV